MKLGIVDEVIDEPLGGAHRDNDKIASEIKKSILNNLKSFENLSGEQIYNQRKTRFLKIGRDKGFKNPSDASEKLRYIEPGFSKILQIIQQRKKIILAFVTILILAAISSIFL